MPVLSAMIRGADDGNDIIVLDYKEDDLDQIFDKFFANKGWTFLGSEVHFLERIESKKCQNSDSKATVKPVKLTQNG